MQQTSGWQVRFFTFWTAQAFSMFGSSLAQFALVWWLTEQTGSATVLALSSLVAIAPGIVLGPLAGVLVDRWNRRLVIVAADLTGALAAATLALLFWLGAIEVWHVYVAMAVRALAGAFHFPAVQSSTSLMAPEEQLARVAGLNQLLQGLIQIAAPPLGALLLGLLPFAGIMGIDVVTALLAVGLLLTVVIPQPIRQPTAGGVATVWHDLLEGFRYIWGWPGLRGVLILSALLNLVLTPAFALTPILVTRHFGGEALQLAWVNTAFGVGFVLGGLLLSVWGGFRQRIKTSLLGVAGLGIGTLLVAGAPADQIAVAVVGMGLVGMMSPLANGPFFAILQSVVAPEIQGRVFTVIMSVSGAMAPLGLLVAGPLADQYGVRLWYLVGGATCLVLVAIMARTPSILHLEEDQRAVNTAASL